MASSNLTKKKFVFFCRFFLSYELYVMVCSAVCDTACDAIATTNLIIINDTFTYDCCWLSVLR